MGNRIRIIIEYDLDLDFESDPTPSELANEVEAWTAGNVEYPDLVGALANPSLKVEVVP